MPYRTITEKYGTLTCGGLPKNTVFGIPVKPTTFLPVAEVPEEDPGWFAPEFLRLARERGFLDPCGNPQAPDNDVTP